MRFEHKMLLTCIGEVSDKIRFLSGQRDAIDPEQDVLDFVIVQHFHMTHGHQEENSILSLHDFTAEISRAPLKIQARGTNVFTSAELSRSSHN